MIEIVKTEYVLTCDHCGAKSEAGEIEKFGEQGWHFDTWNSGTNYKFHSLTCSLECRYSKLRQFAQQQNLTLEVELSDAIRSIAGLVKCPDRVLVKPFTEPEGVFYSGKKTGNV